jgi:peptidoglycan-associated lipoprotein
MKARIAKALTIAAVAASLAACSSVSLDDQAGAGAGADGLRHAAAAA